MGPLRKVVDACFDVKDLGKAISEKQALGWGKAIVPTLSKELLIEFPNMGGFSVGNL